MTELGVIVVTPPISGWCHHIPLFFKPLSTAWTCAFFLFYLFYRNPKIVHFFLPAAYLLLAPVAILHFPSRKIMSRRSLNLYLQKYPSWVRKVEQLLHQKMTVILANSNAVLTQLADVEGVSRSKIRLIYNGVTDLLSVKKSQGAGLREKLGISAEAVVLIAVANILPYKGYHDLVTACGLLRQNGDVRSDWHLIVVGNDSIGVQKDLEILAESSSVGQRLHFVGKQTEIENYLAVSDIGVLVSHEEGFSNAVLEGMIAGLPMIVSDVGGNPEAVVDRQTGLVVPARAPGDLAMALALLIEDRELAQRMGKAGRERAIKEFSVEQSANGYCSVYSSLL
jgi:glycosyltransferase involved in cell wall biosynthesis